MSKTPPIDEAFFKAHIKPLIDKELTQTPEGMKLNVNFEIAETGLAITFTRTPMEDSQ